MKKNIKKALCLALSTAMVVSLFTACGGGKDKDKNKGGQGGEKKPAQTLAPMTTDDIELHVATWENEVFINLLIDKFEEKYPNITVTHSFVAYGDMSAQLESWMSAMQLPDAFWFPQGADTPIAAGQLAPMNQFWEADPENQNLIHGINEYELGYFCTDYKWATPAKFFPSTSWVNQQFFEDNNLNMPSTEWTWDEFEQTIQQCSMEKAKGQRGSDFRSYGLTNANGCYPVTWYPFACSDDCIGEFGWDGQKYNMDGWATGLDKEAEYLAKNWLLHEDFVYNAEFLTATYGDTTPATDTGYVAVRNDIFWCWNQYWNTDSFLNNKVIWVPYASPYVAGEATGKNRFAVMDMAGVGSISQHKREAYELLKYLQWGKDGWLAKLDIYANEINPDTDKPLLPSMIDTPITLDDEVWTKYRAMECFPQDGDEYNRQDYFDKYFDAVKKTYWCTYGANQIPGFQTWINNAYHGNIGVEDQVIGASGVRDGKGISAQELKDTLEEQGLQYFTERHDALVKIIEEFIE